jgi:hypothetical protein
MRLSTSLTEVSSLAGDVEAVERTLQRGDVGYVETRAKNRLVGRALPRTGIFKALWGPWGRR